MGDQMDEKIEIETIEKIEMKEEREEREIEIEKEIDKKIVKDIIKIETIIDQGTDIIDLAQLI